MRRQSEEEEHEYHQRRDADNQRARLAEAAKQKSADHAADYAAAEEVLSVLPERLCHKRITAAGKDMQQHRNQHQTDEGKEQLPASDALDRVLFPEKCRYQNEERHSTGSPCKQSVERRAQEASDHAGRPGHQKADRNKERRNHQQIGNNLIGNRIGIYLAHRCTLSRSFRLSLCRRLLRSRRFCICSFRGSFLLRAGCSLRGGRFFLCIRHNKLPFCHFPHSVSTQCVSNAKPGKIGRARGGKETSAMPNNACQLGIGKTVGFFRSEPQAHFGDRFLSLSHGNEVAAIKRL